MFTLVLQISRIMKDKGKQRGSTNTPKQMDTNRGAASPSTSLLRYLCQPTDPANLAVLRIAFGKGFIPRCKTLMASISDVNCSHHKVLICCGRTGRI